jgi:hypothetical protein
MNAFRFRIHYLASVPPVACAGFTEIQTIEASTLALEILLTAATTASKGFRLVFDPARSANWPRWACMENANHTTATLCCRRLMLSP